jgi:uncharacterized protein YkwD
MVKRFILLLLITLWVINIQSLAAESTTKSPSSNDGMTLSEARLYMLSLVNADRAKYKLPPVTADATASVVAQRHTDEMAVLGYLSHWDTAGRKPPQRYSEAGGTDGLFENLLGTRRQNQFRYTLLRNPLFSRNKLENMESSFMAERAPNDGHRQTILDPRHNKLGIGLSCSQGPAGNLSIYLAQEFLDRYGEYIALPSIITIGKRFQVAGSLFPGVSLEQIDVRWEPTAGAMGIGELNQTTECSIEDRSIMDFRPNGNPATIKVWEKNRRQQFSLWITPEHDWKEGLYYIVISVKQDAEEEPILASLRTTRLRNEIPFHHFATSPP